MPPRLRKSKAVHGLLQKTRLCKYVQDGKVCFHGEACAFAHTDVELCRPPDLLNTRLCRNFEAGRCLYEDSCPFAHGRGALRRRPQTQQTSGANASVRDRLVAIERQNTRLQDVPYRHPESVPPQSLTSLLDWNPRHEEVLHASSYRLCRKNTFLVIDKNHHAEVLQRSSSWPA
eukprot:TRINITY_DN21936_c0_g3_i1.p1 TRINITY_DN21936_c0_g3~~TRINITY_DN21936_c0_g3_i1.p1  ORF type:complete len:174 (-),score=11.48 TRINITY_DN21936_c0_g3_i1:293-814(-)